jgi:hypothetical protein
MTTDIKIKTRDVEGLQQRVKYIDRLKNDIEIGPFTFVTGVVTDSLSVGYPYQVMDPSYNLDVAGSLRVTEDARVLSNCFVEKELFVNGSSTFNDSTFFHKNVSVLGDTYLNTLDTRGNASIQSQLFVNGSSFFASNVSVIGDTFLTNMNVSDTSTLYDVFVNHELRIGPYGSIIYDRPTEVHTLTQIQSSQINVNSMGEGPAIRVNHTNPTFSNILLLEDTGHNVYTVGKDGNTQISGKLRLGFDVVSTNISAIQSGDTFSQTSPFGSHQLEVNGNVSVSGTTYLGGLLTLQNDLTSYSDRRIKKNITPLTNCLDTISQIHGYRFQRTDRSDESYSIGLIAQEVEETYPELVTEVKVGDDSIKTVHYQAFVGVLLECIQELKEKITLLENKIFH